MNQDRDKIELKSGKEIYANRGMDWISNDTYKSAFTREELIELADQMIHRWNQFKADVNMGLVPVKEK